MTKTVHTRHGHGLGLGLVSSRLVSTRNDTTRHATPRLGHGHGPARRGEASERARVARSSPFTNFTSGPPRVHPLSWLRFSLTFNAGLNP
jgi:hypothetical protein